MSKKTAGIGIYRKKVLDEIYNIHFVKIPNAVILEKLYVLLTVLAIRATSAVVLSA